MNTIEREVAVYVRPNESTADTQTLREQKNTFKDLITEKYADKLSIADKTNEEATQ